MKDNTTYLIKNIDRDLWVKFKIKCLKNGHKSAAECFRWFIKQYSKGAI